MKIKIIVLLITETVFRTSFPSASILMKLSFHLLLLLFLSKISRSGICKPDHEFVNHNYIDWIHKSTTIREMSLFHSRKSPINAGCSCREDDHFLHNLSQQIWDRLVTKKVVGRNTVKRTMFDTVKVLGKGEHVSIYYWCVCACIGMCTQAWLKILCPGPSYLLIYFLHWRVR